MKHTYVHRGVLCPVLFAVYIDDLIKELRLAGCVQVGVQYMGSLLYADDIALLAGSCYGLQQMMDICTQYRHTWDILLTNQKPVTYYRMEESTSECDICT